MNQSAKNGYSFSLQSASRLALADPELQRLFLEVIKHFDCSILESFRTDERQEELYRQGKTKLRGGASLHNKKPAKAVDVVPYPIDWNDFKRMALFAGFVKGTAKQLGITVRLGADWNSNNRFDERFVDMPHFELK